ncbi:MAG: TetR/AcrR family transcriptional regulator [Leptolyngbya sp. SIO1E4]|nr:TetR/AcrR family transcriptional regulator [Leptolyngbya sp. SIO1E4]
MTVALNKTDKATQILNGALQEFLARGYAGTSMDRVAATAGVSKPTVYNHFQDKEGLFRALVQKIARERFQLKFNPESLSRPPEESLPYLLESLLETIAGDDEYHDFFRLVIGESGRFPELARTFITYLSKPGLEMMQCYFDNHPEFGFTDSRPISQIVIGSVVHMMLTQYILHGRDIMPLSRDRFIETLTNLLISSPNSLQF